VLLFDANVHSRLTPAVLASCVDALRPDVVAIGVPGGYRPVRHARAYCAAVQSARACYDTRLVLGGHGVAAVPEWALKEFGADCVVVGEGEEVELEDLPLGGVVRAAPIDVSKSRAAYEMLDMGVYTRCPFPRDGGRRTMSIVGGRGCPFACTFCYRMCPGVRMREPETVAAECAGLRRDYGVEHVVFYDELFMLSRKRVSEMCEALRRECAGMTFGVQGRLNLATDDVLREMRDAGVVFINYGIESLDDAALAAMNKHLTVDTIVRGVSATKAVGISPGLNVIWGNIGDSAATLERGVEFLESWTDGAQLRTIRPVTPYPGSALYDEAIRRGLLSGPDDFYAKHVNSDLFCVHFMDGLSNAEAHTLLRKANERLIARHFAVMLDNAKRAAWDLYEGGNAAFAGWRTT
jgi:radical SAM superfamily enzyme YgiQ (UPF0313 family)